LDSGTVLRAFLILTATLPLQPWDDRTGVRAASHPRQRRISSAGVLAAFDPDPLPFIVLMGAGFVVGVLGHIYKSKTVIATGIGMIFLATILLPLGLYLHDR
jgi:hypothetical protein